MGLSYTGRSCLDTARVAGCSRVPEPPARMMPLRVMGVCSPGSTGAVVGGHPFAIGAALDVGHPAGIVQIPLHRLADAGLESLGWPPAQFPSQLPGVDGVAAVVAGAVRDKGDETAVASRRVGLELVEQAAEGVHDLPVGDR